MLNRMMKIKINSKAFETKAFEGVRNKKNLPEIFIREMAKVFGLSYQKAKQMFKIKVTWEEASNELL